MLTVNFNIIGRYIWQSLIFSFHVVRIMLIFMLGSLMAFFVMMRFQDSWGILATLIILLSLADWIIGLYFRGLYK